MTRHPAFTSAKARPELRERGQGVREAVPHRSVAKALFRGARNRCPACGEGELFRAYLKPARACAVCGQELFHHRADDAPPYVVVFVLGHLVIAAVVGVDIAYAWPLWLHALVWPTITVALSLASLPVVKGALVGLQWALHMHGFGAVPDGAAAHPHPDAPSNALRD